MQKFTRPITREIELGGERFALTVSEQGLSVRPVGSRKPPHEMSWAAILSHATGPAAGGAEPGSEEVAAAVQRLKQGAPARPVAPEKAAPTAAHEAPGPTPSSGAKDVGAILARLERWLAQHRRRYLEGLLPPATEADLQALQDTLGRPIPADLRALLSWHNGQKPDFVGHFEHDWDLMSTNEIAVAKRDLEKGGETPTHWQRDWIPFLDNDAGDFVCLDPSQPGAPVREFWLSTTDAPVVAPSLADWLDKFVSAVERGEYHEDPERGTFLKKE